MDALQVITRRLPAQPFVALIGEVSNRARRVSGYRELYASLGWSTRLAEEAQKIELS
jgi:hypothetical protein